MFVTFLPPAALSSLLVVWQPSKERTTAHKASAIKLVFKRDNTGPGARVYCSAETSDRDPVR